MIIQTHSSKSLAVSASQREVPCRGVVLNHCSRTAFEYCKRWNMLFQKPWLLELWINILFPRPVYRDKTRKCSSHPLGQSGWVSALTFRRLRLTMSLNSRVEVRALCLSLERMAFHIHCAKLEKYSQSNDCRMDEGRDFLRGVEEIHRDRTLEHCTVSEAEGEATESMLRQERIQCAIGNSVTGG